MPLPVPSISFFYFLINKESRPSRPKSCGSRASGWTAKILSRPKPSKLQKPVALHGCKPAYLAVDERSRTQLPTPVRSKIGLLLQRVAALLPLKREQPDWKRPAPLLAVGLRGARKDPRRRGEGLTLSNPGIAAPPRAARMGAQAALAGSGRLSNRKSTGRRECRGIIEGATAAHNTQST